MPTIITDTSTLIAHADWLKQTSGGTFGIRGKELESIDKHLLRFQKATSAYGKEWEANEIRIALDNYKKKTADWKTGSRNKTGAIGKLDWDLAMLGLSQPLPTGQDAGIATNLRMGTLYFLSRLKSDTLPTDWGRYLSDSLDKASDVHDALRTAQAQGGAMKTAKGVANNIKDQAKGNDAASGFLKSTIETARNFIGDLAGPVSGLLQQAVAGIVRALPDLLTRLLGAVLQNLGAAVEIAGNLAKAARAAVATFSSRHLEEGVTSGHPRTVVNAVREQIKDHGKEGLGEAFQTALLTGIGALNPVAGAVVSGIVAIFKFLSELWERIKERVKLAAVVLDAKKHYANKLYNDAAAFQEWFLETIKDMPLLSCYCMRMPMTGGYYGFLTLISTDGSPMSYEQLERNYGEFNDVKTWAEKFIRAGKVRLSSDDKMVAHSIQVASGKEVSETKQTLKARVKKTMMTMVEQAAG